MDYRRFAVVYGVADYESLPPPAPGGGTDLTYTDDDAEDLGALLAAQGFDGVQVRLSRAGSHEATIAQLEADFAAAAAQAGPDDLFLFYFSGHGGSTAQGEVILLDGAAAPDPLGAAALAALLGSVPAGKRVVVIDACNSGGLLDNPLEADGYPPDYAGMRRNLFSVLGEAISLFANFGGEEGDLPPSLALVMSAAGEREESWEAGAPYYHGIFTYFLLQAPRRGDRNTDGWITVSEAYGYVRDAVESEYNRRYRDGSPYIFLPRISGGPVDYALFEAR